MTPATADSAIWHRIFGALVDAIDRPNFWYVLVRSLQDALHFESWVVLCFAHDGRPEVLAESPGADGGEDKLFKDYLNGFYLLDPFYLDCLEDPRTGLIRLDDVAPDHFEAEDYFQRYFQLNVVKDEVQFNLPLPQRRVLALSLGSPLRFSVADMTLMTAMTPWILGLMRQRLRFERLLAEPLHGSGAVIEVRREPAVSGSPAAAETRPAASALGMTARELQILHLLLSGHSSKGIAQKLHISPETVKAHRRHIYTKLGVRSHPELFTMLLRAGALPVGGRADLPLAASA
jgi:DNA-binding CsgD family transcriptional regulator